MSFEVKDAGIDKLRLVTKDFVLSDYTLFDGMPKKRKAGQTYGDLAPYMVDLKGEKVYERLIMVKPDYTISVNEKGLSLIVNPSTIVDPSGFHLVNDLDQVDAILKGISDSVSRDLQTRFDYREMRVSRLDLATQQHMDQPISNYRPVFSLLGSKAMQDKKYNYSTSYNFGNKAREVNFYDKGLQLGRNDVLDLMRGEVRLLTTKEVKDALSLNSVSDLLKFDEGDLNSIYKDFMQGDVFGDAQKDSAMKINFKKLYEKLETAKKESDRYYISNTIKEIGLATLCSVDGALDMFEEALKRLGNDRSVISRNMKKLRDLKGTGISLKNYTVSPMVLLKELKMKFAA